MHSTESSADSLDTLKHVTPLHEQFDSKLILNRDGQRHLMLQGLIPKTLTQDTAEFGQLVELHKQIDSTITRLGSAALLRDLCHPCTNLPDIEARRQAIKELQENTELREALTKGLQATQAKFLRGMSVEETALLALAPDVADTSLQHVGRLRAFGEKILKLLNPSRDIPVRLSALSKVLRTVENIPTPTSPILVDALTTIRNALNSPDSALLSGKAAVTYSAIESRARVPWYVPSYSVSKALVNIEERPVVAVGVASAVLIVTRLLTTAEATLMINRVTAPLMLFACGMAWARNMFVNEKTALKLQARVKTAQGLCSALDAIGELDALLSLAQLKDRFGPCCCLPRFVDKGGFEARYVAMKNPTLALQQHCVVNDCSIEKGKALLLTGPNSGGKTTIATAILQNQVLAQIGSPIPALDAELTVADQILYQGPTFKALGEHGKFGTEVAATRDIFKRATRNSLVILDEVGDGTSAREGRKQAFAAVRGFTALDIGLVVVSHNRPLVRRLAKYNLGTPYMMGSEKGEPTYRLVPGISEHSDADRIAKILKFSRAHIKEEVKKRLSAERNPDT